MEDVLMRLRQLIKKENLELVDFAVDIDEKPQRIKNILGGHQRVPGEVLCKVVKKFKVDANWLILGEKGVLMYRQPVELMVPLTRAEKALVYDWRDCPGPQQDAIKRLVKVLAEAQK